MNNIRWFATRVSGKPLYPSPWLLVLALLAASLAAPAAVASDGEKLGRINDALAVAGGRFNEFHRLNAERAYIRGQKQQAAEQYRLAAGFADKFSQHRLSLMYWQGDGVPRDRVRAYIWADLAAERGTPSLLANREKMWRGLATAEREQVVVSGPDYCAEFGDEVAKPRQIARMLAASRNHTGTRTGYDGYRLEMTKVQGVAFLQHVRTVDDLSIPVSAENLYGFDRSNPDAYWRMQDSILAGGTVEVGELQAEAADRRDRSGGKHRDPQRQRLL